MTTQARETATQGIPAHRHGRERFFVVGEGWVPEPDEGEAWESASSLAAAASSPGAFRFSRLGPRATGHQLDEAARKALGTAMAAGGGAASQIPAGFTYFGQFLDHDLTFDKTQVAFGANVPPGTMLEGRSPALDLDSLYGAGPSDPVSSKFYAADGLHLKMGTTVAAAGIPAKAGFDLPRGAGTTAAQKRRAIIPEPRNDENLAVASTHLAMIRFHNRVVDTLPSSVPAAQRFDKAREIVTKHYQWAIRTDYLTRICHAGTVADVFDHHRKIFEVGAAPTQMPTMPIEFSVAAFRLGHSMVRPFYSWNSVFDDGSGTLDLLFLFSGTSGDFAGDARLPSTWIADFRRLYDFGEAGKANLKVPAAKFNRAMRIDTRIAGPLRDLPAGSFGGTAVSAGDIRANLAFRNLTRANMVKLATGQQMATLMKQKGVALTKLSTAQLRDGNGGAHLDKVSAKEKQALVRDTPLWFYILREAEASNGQLNGVGARLVAETFHRAMEGSHFSIVRDTAFRPTLGPNSSTFRMVDLLLFAFNGDKSLLAPLG